MTYDNEGRFVPQRFEDIFAKYDRGNKGGLDAWDLLRFHKGQRMVFDFFGWSAAFLECVYSIYMSFIYSCTDAPHVGHAVYLLLWPEDGICRKDDIRRIFDGSIFQQKADEYAVKQRTWSRLKGIESGA